MRDYSWLSCRSGDIIVLGKYLLPHQLICEYTLLGTGSVDMKASINSMYFK